MDQTLQLSQPDFTIAGITRAQTPPRAAFGKIDGRMKVYLLLHITQANQFVHLAYKIVS